MKPPVAYLAAVLLYGSLTSVMAQSAPSDRTSDKPGTRYVREGTEWVTTWIPNANTHNQPRVLLVGDSITKAYAPEVTRQLQPSATTAYFTTSASVADPAFVPQLQGVLAGYQFSVIHFNNGLHGFGFSDAEYRSGYEQALNTIRQSQPRARLILALTTPLRSDTTQADLNPRVAARNAIVRELAAQFDAEIDDLHAISNDHPEYYTDPYHYKLEAINLQAAQAVELLRAAVQNADNEPKALGAVIDPEAAAATASRKASTEPAAGRLP